MRAYLRALAYLLSLHVLGLVATGILRLAIFVSGHHFLGDGGFSAWGAFLRGVWFDNVVACYISILPLAALTLSYAFGRGQRGALVFTRWWMAVLWTLVILVSCADIPYFLYFFKNINAGIWNWTEYGGTTLGMLLGEKAYYPPLLAFLALAALFVWLSGKLLPRKDRRRMWPTLWALVIGLPMIGLCLFGIRGRRGYNPIKVSQMKGSDIPLYNGLPTVLKGEGYRTMFFMTHESQYDNMNAFFRTNGYEEIYSQENYPRDKVVNSFGVQDDFLFSFAIDRLKTQRQPFFATLLSLLGIGAEQNNFGVDLLARRRPCAFYTADNVIGARSEDRLFVFNPSTEQTFLYLDGELQHTEDSAFNALRQHAFSMLQAAQYVVGKGETQ